MLIRSTVSIEDSANVTLTSDPLLSSQHRMDNLNPTLSLAQPMSSEVIFNLIIMSTIGILIYACIPKRKQPSSRLKIASKIACSHCQFFYNNHFLKCALHPVTVMTEEAVDCKDYCKNIKIK
jgi:hypothetical protein